MNDIALQLVGGPLDGLYLPLTPEAKTSPRQLIVFSPLNQTWTSYADAKRRTGPTDVYKIRAGARLVVSKPPEFKIVRMAYQGMISAEEAKVIEELAREHRAD